MVELGNCGFMEFIESGFANEFTSKDKDGNNMIATPGAKIVLSVEEYDYGHYLHDFYKKGPQRWVKKLEVSDDELWDDCTVRLMGSDNGEKPESIIFDFWSKDFEFVLTNEMIKAIEDAVKYGIDDYFPGYTDKEDRKDVYDMNEFLDPAMTPDMSYFDAPGHFGYGFSFKKPEKSKTYKAVLRLLKNGPMKKGDILNALNACGALPYRNIDWNNDPGKRGECSSMFIAMRHAGLLDYDKKTHLWSLGPRADYYMARFGILKED